MLPEATSPQKSRQRGQGTARSSRVTLMQGHRQPLESVNNQDKEMGNGVSVCIKS